MAINTKTCLAFYEDLAFLPWQMPTIFRSIIISLFIYSLTYLKEKLQLII